MKPLSPEERSEIFKRGVTPDELKEYQGLVEARLQSPDRNAASNVRLQELAHKINPDLKAVP